MSAQTLQITRPAERVIESADRLEIADWTTAADSDLLSGRRVLTVRLQGCTWQCSNCEQPELRDAVTRGAVPWREVREVLTEAASGLDAVVLSGGEATRQDGLIDAIGQIRALGLPVAVHTSGTFPRRLAELVPPAAVRRVPVGSGRVPART